jgi:hypothetical protein
VQISSRNLRKLDLRKLDCAGRKRRCRFGRHLPNSAARAPPIPAALPSIDQNSFGTKPSLKAIVVA